LDRRRSRRDDDCFTPRTRAARREGAVAAFEAFERRFASQVRVSILLVGLSGAYMLMKDGAWDRLQHASFWWLHLMIAVWVLFALIVYVLEPLVLHRLFREFALRNKDRAFALATGLHALALSVAAFATGAPVSSAHTADCLKRIAVFQRNSREAGSKKPILPAPC
jgi:hypothetical protein